MCDRTFNMCRCMTRIGCIFSLIIFDDTHKYLRKIYKYISVESYLNPALLLHLRIAFEEIDTTTILITHSCTVLYPV